MNKIYKTIIGNDTTILQRTLCYRYFLKNDKIVSVLGKMVFSDEVREFLNNDDKNKLNIKDESIDINAIGETESCGNPNFLDL